ncbi:MAG TPA: proton-conducting transporter membrane subunit [Candidatus Limnocylindria bacterium]|nr:proton-conducting transporter membrane subunit [Candidatus Limnocylindria bacterium]
MSVPGPLPDVVMTWRLDGLGAYFGLVILVISTATASFAIGHRHHHAGFRGSGALLGLFVVSMLGVVLAGDAFSFLIAWEAMSLASFALVLTDHRRADVRRSAWIYVVMTHAATALVVVAFLVLARATGSLSFAEWSLRAATLDPPTASLVFVLGLIGFGTKAGMIPVHVWLPRAHPVAPAPVSALMSGVMIKLGIYGLVRLTFDWLAPGPAWWGSLILMLGAASAVLGVLYALMEHDLKRLLAYHSVENIGIILMGLGTAVVARSLDAPAVVAIGLAAALFHVANHATFKALLFMGAGAIDAATGTRDLERLGGLARRMPVTAATFLVGSAAISALPPLNGFASEWLTFQGLLALGHAARDPQLALLPLLLGGALALTGALALACFVKAFGVSFLALPRSPRAAAAHEAGRPELVAMVTLAVACVALGVGAVPVLAAIGTLVPAAALSGGLSSGPLAIADGRVDLPGLAALVVALGIAALAAPRLLGPVRTRVAETWVCGVALHPVHGYTATAFAKPIRLMFRGIVRPVREVEIVHRSGTRFVASVQYRSHIAPVFERYVYRAFTDRLVAFSHVIRRAQNGSLQTYLAYLIAALVAALVIAR